MTSLAVRLFPFRPTFDVGGVQEERVHDEDKVLPPDFDRELPVPDPRWSYLVVRDLVDALEA